MDAVQGRQVSDGMESRSWVEIVGQRVDPPRHWIEEIRKPRGVCAQLPDGNPHRVEQELDLGAKSNFQIRHDADYR
jgi:hypothetical protein